jgi:pimeloyl-ACP methyl ester carboxylesterase
VVEHEADPVILVGHSRGGVVISEVAERIPDRIAALVYVSGYLYSSGQSILSNAPSPSTGGANIFDMRENGTCVLKSECVRPIFYNGCTEDEVATLSRRLSPEPLWAFTTPVEVSEGRFGRVKRAYVEAKQDNIVPLDTQRAMQAALPCSPVFTLDSDHSPFFSKPHELAQCFLSVAAQVTSESASARCN